MSIRADPLGRTIFAARAAVAEAQEGLTALRGARELLDQELAAAKSTYSFSVDSVEQAALRVLASETLEDMISACVESRASYIASIGGLAWLVRRGAVPQGDARPHQLVLDANTAPSTWREAESADGGLGGRLVALLGDAP